MDCYLEVVREIVRFFDLKRPEQSNQQERDSQRGNLEMVADYQWEKVYYYKL
jgi:hypothetical protein